MTSPVESLRLFPTPLIIAEVDGAELLNEQLAALILAKKADDRGIRRSNLGGWHSNTDLADWAGPAGKRLADEAIALATGHTEVTGFDSDALDWQVEAWANVSGSGHSNQAHVHGGAFWSLVYYVQLGAGQGGRLVLHDPRMPALAMHAPGLRFRDAGPEMSAPITPKPGQLIMFPSWLSHSVEPWTGSGERISVAINLSARRSRKDLPKASTHKVSIDPSAVINPAPAGKNPS